jgi:nicotinate phosphoribosyltransferase
VTTPAADPLLTDLYQLTMLQGYWQHGMHDDAVFEFFVRKLPPQRNFLLAAGLEQALQFIEAMRFAPDDIDWLRSTGRFDDGFLAWLAGFRFTGAVDAMPEGTVFFPDEPILRVVAPMPQAQLLETRLVNLLHYQTLVASKAARMVLAAPGRSLIDFGLRRAHGAEAGLLAARAAYLAGFTGSATVAAERDFGVPAFGTVAHSFIQAHADESEAFRHFAASWPGSTVFLIDTYDTEAGARKVVALAPELNRRGIRVNGVRLDSGDLVDLAFKVRRILDDGGLGEARIIASSSIDEYFLAEATRVGAPIDGYGVGTHLTTSADAPYLDCVYKLQEYAGVARRKRSAGKSTWPGRKQVFRRAATGGRIGEDVLTLEGDRQSGEPLLAPIMRGGRRLAEPEPLARSRERAAAALAALPEALKSLERAPPYSVVVAPALRALAAEVDARTAGG